MGWTTTYNYGNQSTAELVTKNINGSNEHGSWEVLDHSVRGSVFYGLVKHVNFKTSTTVHYAVVYLTSRKNGDFSYKDMDESCNPYYYDCPKRILDKLDVLSPEPVGYSKLWRETCRQKIQQTKTSLTDGQVVVFKNELNFRVFKENTFTVVKIGAKIRFRTSKGVLCCITNWRDREFA